METTKSFSLEEITERDHNRVVPAYLPINTLNLLTQVRQSITDIEELANSIRLKGQLAQGIVVALNPRQASEYVRELNYIRDTVHKLSELVSVEIDGSHYYLILVAGHRRYYAVRQLADRQTTRYTKRFPEAKYRATLYFGMNAADALSVQFQENRHKKVPVHEEAAAAWDFYRWQKRRNPKITLTAFGRSIGRSATWVRTMVGFCSLPDSLQTLASLKDNAVPYGILTQAARLSVGLKTIGKPIEESDLVGLVIDAVVRRTTVSRFKEIVTARLEHQRNGQTSLFSDIPQAKRPIRQAVAPELTRGMYGMLAYQERLDALLESGVFGPDDYLEPETNPEVLKHYSGKSPVRLTSKLVDQLRSQLPRLEQLAASEGGRHRKVLEDGKSIVAQASSALEQLVAQEGKVP